MPAHNRVIRTAKSDFSRRPLTAFAKVSTERSDGAVIII